MSFTDVVNYFAGNTTNFSNLTSQSSGLNATTVDVIKKMENLTNACSSSTSCFIGLNSPVASAMSSASYIQQMSALLNQGLASMNQQPNSVFDAAKTSYTSAPVAPKQTQAPAPAPAQTTAPAPKQTPAPAPAPEAEDKTQEEHDKMLLEMSDAFRKRHQSDKAEAEAAKAKKAANRTELMDLVKQVADKKANPYTGDSYFFNYANNRIAELEKTFSKDELRAIYKEIEDFSKPEIAKDTTLPQNNGINAAHKIQAEKIRAQYIENPRQGSELAILRSQYQTVLDLEAKSITCGYLPSKNQLENRIREIESGEAEAILTTQINKLEEETKEYQGETHWYNVIKNSKLDELENLKEKRANLY